MAAACTVDAFRGSTCADGSQAPVAQRNEDFVYSLLVRFAHSLKLVEPEPLRLELVEPELWHDVHALQLLEEQLAGIGHADGAEAVSSPAVLAPAL